MRVFLRLAVLCCLTVSLLISPLASAQGYTFDLKWGARGTLDGEFSGPRDVAVDSSGNVYVTDTNNNRIQKFDSNGNFLTKWGSAGSLDGEFNRPYRVTIDSSGDVYVSDHFNSRIQKFDSNGNFLSKWGSSGTGNGQFVRPSGVAVDSLGNVYVGEGTLNAKKVAASGFIPRIQKFNASATYLTQWGSVGTGDGQFDSTSPAIKDVAADGSDDIYVSDSAGRRIQKFDSSGTFLTKWGSFGTGDGQFTVPWGVAVDDSGNVYVTDYDDVPLPTVSRVQKFDSSGNFFTKWGSLGSGEGEFKFPSGVAVDGSGNVYVADAQNDRIQKFTPPPAPIVTVDTLTTADTSPPLSGTIDDAGASISVTVDGQTNPATNNGATWDLADGTLSALPPGTYDVVVTAINAFGINGTDASTSELTLASTNPGNGGTITNNKPPAEIFPGQSMELTGPAGGFNYQWKKDGVPMVEDAPRITGTQTQILVIDPIRPTDQGSYTVAYDDGLAKKIVETEPILIVVNPPMPVAGLWALGALALALLAAGLVVVKRSGHSSHAKS